MSHPSPLGRPAFIVHSLAQATAAAQAAAESGRPIALLSGGYLAWPSFRSLCAAAQAAVPAAQVAVVFDPGERGGFAAEALAKGAPAVIFPARHPQRAVLESVAAGLGASVLPPFRQACDLAGARDPLAVSRAWLASRRR